LQLEYLKRSKTGSPTGVWRMGWKGAKIRKLLVHCGQKKGFA